MVSRNPLQKLKDSPYQMRKEMDGDELQELTENIARNGLESPVTAREKDRELQIVCGQFTRMHAQLLANAAGGEVSQKTADELTAK